MDKVRILSMQKTYTQYQQCMFQDPDDNKWYEGYICGDRVINGFQFFVVEYAKEAKVVFSYTHGIYDAEGVRLCEPC